MGALRPAAACVTVTAIPETVIVPLREAVDVFAKVEKFTVPFPEPLAPLVIVIHEALSVAVHAQPLPAVTVTLDVPAAAATATFVGDGVIVQGALCVMVTACPPIVIAPLRGDVDVFAVTEYVTVPFPEPLAPPVIVIQEALSVAVHPQPLPAATATLDVPAAADMVTLVGDGVIVQGAFCVMVTACPPIVIAPLRGDVDVFAVTEYVTVPFPEPLAPPVIVIQEALSVAVHPQPFPAAMARLDVPEAADMVTLVGDGVIVQGALCVMVTACPPIVIAPLRNDVDVFAVTEYVTVPFPEPLAPPVIVIQEASSVAVHPQPLPAATATLDVPAAADMVTLVGDGVIVQGALCVMVTACPPIVIAPLRGDVDVFAVTEYVTVPFPEPLAPPVIVIQEALSVAVHPQPLPAVTATLPVPAAAVIG